MQSCRPGEKDWNGASFISQESQMDNLLEGDVTTQASDPPDEDIFITKKPLVVFTVGPIQAEKMDVPSLIAVLRAEVSTTSEEYSTRFKGCGFEGGNKLYQVFYRDFHSR